MALYIIQNKVYDTNKMEFVGTVRKWYEYTSWVYIQIYGQGVGREYDCKLYRSDKGNWLLTHEGETSTCGEAISENEAKDLLMHNNYKAYTKYFGSLEEA